MCDYGVDPLYFDDVSTIKWTTYNVAMLTTASTIDMVSDLDTRGPAYWALVYYDVFGEDWVTHKFPVGASCAEVIKALQDLPNRAVPLNSLACYRLEVLQRNPLENVVNGNWNITFQSAYTYFSLTLNPRTYGSRTEYAIIKPTFWKAGYANSYDVMSPSDELLSGYVYRLEFQGVPGFLKQPKIVTNVDGYRPTITSPGGELFTAVWTDGEQGEFMDYFSDHCAGVSVSISTDSYKNTYLTSLTGDEEDLLKQCLGKTDGNQTGIQTTIDWDGGNERYLHFVKFVPSIGDFRYKYSFYGVIWYDMSLHVFTGGLTTLGTFRVLNPARAFTFSKNAMFDVYCSDGVLALTSMKSEVVFDFASNMLYTININYDKNGNGDTYNGDISCETYDNLVQQGSSNAQHILHCLNEGDKFVFFDFHNQRNNPTYVNLYTVTSIYSLPEQVYVGDDQQLNIADGLRAVAAAPFRTHRIETDLSTNWAHDLDETSQFRIYKFITSKTSEFEYVAPCSNRGTCNYEDGSCDCDEGYNGFACSVQTGHTV
jgi:hypothetical protein